jgi:hypothetical protein
VIELDFGILVYPTETDGEPWRAVFTENGQRKFRQGATEEKLAAKLENVKERLQADAANMERPGADPAEIPSDSDIGKLGRALAAGLHGERDELMACTAAYSGLRWGELTALTVWQVDQAGRVITVDRQVVEVAGHLYVEAPKCRKYPKTIYPAARPTATRSPASSPPASSRLAPSRKSAPTRWG